MSQTPENIALSQTKYDLMNSKGGNAGFLAAVLFPLPVAWAQNVPVIATDGEALYVNPDTFPAIDRAERVNWLVLVVWHIVLLQFARKGFREEKYFTPACIHSVLEMMHNAGQTLPPAMQYDPSLAGKSLEQIYAYLHSNNIELPHVPTIVFLNDPRKTEEIKDKQEMKIRNAAVMTKPDLGEFGDQGCSALVNIRDAMAPRVDFEQELAAYATTLVQNDYSYRRPNRHYQDFVLPTLCSPGIGKIVAACDSSGSVTDHEFSVILRMIDNMINLTNPIETEVISFDTSIQSRHIITPGQTATALQFTGRGGTSLFPLFEEVEKDAPDVLVVFSDLDCAPIEKSPPFPVIWICINNPHASVNFGKLIHVDTQNHYD